MINKIVGTDGIVEANMTAPFIAAVSDGVSSELSGEVASRLCMKFLRNIKISPKTNLQNRILKIHERLKDTVLIKVILQICKLPYVH